MIVASHPMTAPREGDSRDGESNATLLRSIAILAPTGRDAQVTMQVLAGAGVHPIRCDDIRALCDAIDAGVGAVLVTEEALGAEAVRGLLAALDRQPSWSDIPLLVLASAVGLRQGVSPRLAHLMEHANVTLLERPVRVATLVTSLQASLRARRWQFDLRDQLEALRETQRTLLESERTLRVAREEAESANRIKSEFLAVMSHELRTPLNAIGGYAELLALGVRGPVSREQREDLERIRRSQQHLLGLINEVLNYARIEAGSVRYTIDDVPLADAVAYVLMLVTPQANDKGLSLFHDEGRLRGLVARADADKTRQILLNLLSNAVKFTHRGGRITITGRTVPGKVIVDVTDTGIGISEHQLEQVFEPFVQVNSTLTRTQEGTGLGLAISRDLARGMGGELTAHSALGKGSTFTLTLPCAPR